MNFPHANRNAPRGPGGLTISFRLRRELIDRSEVLILLLCGAASSSLFGCSWWRPMLRLLILGLVVVRVAWVLIGVGEVVQMIGVPVVLPVVED